LYRQLKQVGSPPSNIIRIRDKDYLHFSSNDYLGLAQDHRIVQATREVLAKWGTGSGASPLITGHNQPSAVLEQEICSFKNTRSALVFPSGYSANVGAISCLADQGDLILSDALNHASIIDGCRLSRARLVVYPHLDLDFVQDQLKKSAEKKVLIVTDSIFSMDGDLAPLAQLSGLGRKYGALLYVDDAHGTGVLGHNGQGAASYCGLENEEIVQMGTFSKALGSQGGFVAGSELLVDYLINHCRSYIFSTALPPHVLAANKMALKVAREDSTLRDRLQVLGEYLRHELKEIGIRHTGQVSHIFSLIIGRAEETISLYRFLLEQGIFIPPIRPPTVPENTSRLRVSLSAKHEFEDIKYLIHCLKDWLNMGRHNE
jgi:8-amino-7-oxononanoate synthase